MIRINQIKIPVQKDETSALKKKIQKTLRTNHPYTYQIVRKSLDARDKGNLLHIYTVDVEFERSQDIPRNIIDNKNIMLTKDEKYTFPHRCRDDCNEKTDVSVYRPVIIGAGPAGYFAALQLACAGYRPIVYERGKCVEERTRDVEGFWQGETPICANSNVSFGEGGAGTFSDGKLNTGIKDKYGRIQAVIHDFIRFGASEEIGYLNKPHIGTDVLKHVMKKMREEIQSFGGEIHFSHQLTAISKVQQVLLVVAAVAVIAGIVILFRKSPKFEGKKHVMRTMVVCIVMWIGIMFFTNFNVSHNIISDDFANLGMAYQDYGGSYCSQYGHQPSHGYL